MPQFFIHRPVFAWVIALFIVLAGVIAIPKLPISRYPSVAPVSVTLYATYPGATPQTLNDAVVSLIKQPKRKYCSQGQGRRGCLRSPHPLDFLQPPGRPLVIQSAIPLAGADMDFVAASY